MNSHILVTPHSTVFVHLHAFQAQFRQTEATEKLWAQAGPAQLMHSGCVNILTRRQRARRYF